MTTPRSAKEKIILALDVPDEAAALRLVRHLGGVINFFKIGLELFVRCGPGVVERVREVAYAANGQHGGIFLDLKLHDIPNTVAAAVRAASQLNVDLLTVHLSGGGAMLRAASAEAREKLLLLGVSVLTSSDEQTLAETGVPGTVADRVMRLASLGVASGLRGAVASPHEVAVLRQRFGRDLTIVTPGVRPAASGSPDDQRRVMTPRQAIEAGADYLVIGRPITAHADPKAAAQAIIGEMSDAD